MPKKQIIFGIVALCFFIYAVLVLSRHPSHEREWARDQQYLPEVSIEGDSVHIEYVRDFVYNSTSEFEERYQARTVDVNDIVSIDYLVEPFGNWKGPAHTLVSFGFQTSSGTEYIAVSGEIRKEAGESFSPLNGLLRQYELLYVVGTEADLIGLRTNHRKDNVYLYPIRTTPEHMKQMFLSMMTRVQGIATTPEFYNTVTNNCTSNIRSHVNEIMPGRVPWSFSMILPASSDRQVYELGLIDTELSFEEAKEHFFITDIANTWENGQDFSPLIRSQREDS